MSYELNKTDSTFTGDVETSIVNKAMAGVGGIFGGENDAYAPSEMLWGNVAVQAGVAVVASKATRRRATTGKKPLLGVIL